MPSAIFHALPPIVFQSLCVLHVTAETAVFWYLHSHEVMEEQRYQLTVAAEQCKVSLHLILVTKCYYTAAC